MDAAAPLGVRVQHPRLFIRRLGVVAGNLQAGYVQLDFFTDYKAQEREERLQRVLLEIRQKYGPTAPRVIMKGNSKLARANMIRVSIEYFVVCTDEENDTYLVKGLYKTITGIVLKVDQHEQRIAIRSGADTEVISFADIYRIFRPT